MNLGELVKKCGEKAGWKNFVYLHSFTGNFEFYKGIVENNIDEKDTEIFIEICDNRIDLAKVFLQDIATVLGFFITSLTIVLAISGLEQGKNHADPFLDTLIGNYGNLFPILVFSLIAGIVILSGLLLKYRTQIHSWTAFKEEAILNKRLNKNH